MNSENAKHKPSECPCCGGKEFSLAHIYSSRPDGETVFEGLNTEDYHREIWSCDCCGHFLSIHDIDLDNLYSGQYIDSTYGDLDAVKKKCESILALPFENSDNAARVQRVIAFAKQHFANKNKEEIRILDVGSGLGVFLAAIKDQTDWVCTALEPDDRYAEHARVNLEIEAVAEDYRKIDWDREFDIIAINKVLEHIEDPLSVLKRSCEDLSEDGFMYIELPDGEVASSHGFGREEFFLEHHHVFSMASMELLCKNAGLQTQSYERLHEPSTKFTLVNFSVNK